MPQGRRVRRVIRKVDTWSVLKLSLLFFGCMLVMGMVAGVVLWQAARRVGTITYIEDQVKKYADLKSFEILGPKVFTTALLTGLVLVLLGTAITTIGSMLYNLLSDIVGGVQIIMIEEAPVRRARRTAPVPALPLHENDPGPYEAVQPVGGPLAEPMLVTSSTGAPARTPA